MSVYNGNFNFLDPFDRRVAQLARQAEKYVHTDPESCLFKLRLMVETMTKRLVEMQMPQLISADLGTMLRALERSGTVPRPRADTMHAIRRDGNAAVHGDPIPGPTAMRRLRDAHGLSAWFCGIMRRGTKLRPEEFVPPPCPTQLGKRVEVAIAEAEQLEDEIEARRRQTREALLMFGGMDDIASETTRLREELESLDRVASEAGEPTVDAESVMIVMAMELEQLLEHPTLGLTSRDAKREAEKQLDDVKRHLDERERDYAAERARIAEATWAG